MALSCSKTMPNNDADVEDQYTWSIECGYHVLRAIEVDLSAGSSGATGVTLQSYVNETDFASRGWNAPRASVSFFWNAVPNSTDLKAWVEQRIIDNEAGWSEAARAA